jgi:hypothetical protein
MPSYPGCMSATATLVGVVGWGIDPFVEPAPAAPLAAAPSRVPVAVRGVVRGIDTVHWAGGMVAEVALADDDAGLVLVFFTLSRATGLRLGDEVVAQGTIGRHRGRPVMLNPAIWSRRA